MDTENRKSFYDRANDWERVFISNHEGKVIQNPSRSISKFAPDLFLLDSSESADLKLLFEPYYKSKEKFGIDPLFAWSFNDSDFREYQLKYGDHFKIIIWQRFEKSSMFGVDIEETEKIWGTTIFDIKREIRKSKNFHKYIRRQNDTNGNSYASHILDLRNL